MRDTERGKQRHRQSEKQAPCREPSAGFDPRTPGSRPEPKAGAELLSYPGIPYRLCLSQKLKDLLNAQTLNSFHLNLIQHESVQDSRWLFGQAWADVHSVPVFVISQPG